MRSILILIAGIILTVQAQVMLPHRKAVRVPPFNPDSFFPTNMILLRWKASDLSSSPVSVWTDEIQGYNLIQTNGAKQPTWSTNGVAFTGGQYLNMTNMDNYGPDGALLCAWLIVMRFDDSSETSQLILGQTMSGGALYVGIGGTPSFFYEGGTGDNAVGPLSSGTNFDFLICNSNAIGGGIAYTNAIQAWSSPASHWTYGGAPTALGCVPANAAQDFKGRIMEIIVWSNAVWTASEVNGIHKYATSVYPIPF